MGEIQVFSNHIFSGSIQLYSSTATKFSTYSCSWPSQFFFVLNAAFYFFCIECCFLLFTFFFLKYFINKKQHTRVQFKKHYFQHQGNVGEPEPSSINCTRALSIRIHPVCKLHCNKPKLELNQSTKFSTKFTRQYTRSKS